MSVRTAAGPHPFREVLTARFKIRVVENLLTGEDTCTLLDVGCGAGYLLWQIGDKATNCYGMDADTRAVSEGAAYVKAGLSVAVAERLPYADASFEAVVSTDAFEHIPDDHEAIREIRRILKPGGVCVIYAPSSEGLFSETYLAHLFHDQDDFMLDQRNYTMATLKDLVEGADLTVEAAGYHNILAQEVFTQTLKGLAALMGKEYRHQGQIRNITDSWPYKLYRWVALPVIAGIVRVEEFLVAHLTNNRVRGHRVYVKCRRPS